MANNINRQQHDEILRNKLLNNERCQLRNNITNDRQLQVTTKVTMKIIYKTTVITTMKEKLPCSKWIIFY